MGGLGGQRRDAQANRQAVIDAAIDFLAEHPDASIQEIADASGVGRTTVYRHFPDRAALFESLTVEAEHHSSERIREVIARGKPPDETLRNLGGTFVELGLRFAFLYSHRELSKPTLQERGRSGDWAISKYLERAQVREEIRNDQPVSWMSATVLSLSMAAVTDVLAGRVDQERAGRLLGDTFVSAFASG